MMNPNERIVRQFSQSIETLQDAVLRTSDAIEAGALRLAQCLLNDGKILVCGNGASAAAAQHFSALLLNRFERDRPGLPAFALTGDTATLTSIANDHRYDEVYAKQIRALGQASDVLVIFTSSGNSANILGAATAAHDRDMAVIALSGRDGGALTALLRETDVEIRAPAEPAPRVHEVHLITSHCLCDLVDHQLFGE